jgi:hypothetical protein
MIEVERSVAPVADSGRASERSLFEVSASEKCYVCTGACAIVRAGVIRVLYCNTNVRARPYTSVHLPVCVSFSHGLSALF